jgi:hypothetical protein
VDAGDDGGEGKILLSGCGGVARPHRGVRRASGVKHTLVHRPRDELYEQTTWGGVLISTHVFGGAGKGGIRVGIRR